MFAGPSVAALCAGMLSGHLSSFANSGGAANADADAWFLLGRSGLRPDTPGGRPEQIGELSQGLVELRAGSTPERGHDRRATRKHPGDRKLRDGAALLSGNLLHALHQ